MSNKTNSPKVVVGIISYNDQKYLKLNLPAILAQTYENYEVIVCNNQPENGISEWIEKEFPQIEVVQAGGNIGFGKAHNFMINLARKKAAEYYLCFNSDMVASQSYLADLVTTIKQDQKIGCVTGKLISWTNFPQEPQQIPKNHYLIDTTGLKVLKNGQVIDRGQGEQDLGQFDREEEVFGASGASPLLRIKALEDIAHSEGEFFDRLFFMYKEDVDLAFRLRWAGWKTVYTPLAVAWHDRTTADIKGFWAKIQERRSRPTYIKNNSFLNQLILMKKNFLGDFSLATKIRMKMFYLSYFAYLMIFDWKVLKQLATFIKLRAKVKDNAKKMPRRVSAREMESWFGR